MTEKRFWIFNTLTEYSGIKDRDKLLTFNEVVDLLNTLHEENQNLRECINEIYIISNKIKTLGEENG